ncbi:hypothetical protein GCM10028801_25020 [Nocardioides maradonensis]
MRDLADRHPRYGYRRVHALLVAEGWAVNVKRIERLWRLEGLHVPPSRSKESGQKARGVDENSAWALPAVRPMHVWSYDFVSARLDNGSAFRVLNIVDEHTKVAPRQLDQVLDRGSADHRSPRAALRGIWEAEDDPLGQRARVHRRHAADLAR